LHHVVTGQKSLAEIIVEGPYGLRVIPGASGLPDLADLPNAHRETLLRSLLVLDGTLDLLLIDTSPGVGYGVVQFVLAAGEMLLVTTPEPTAITDAYALMKVLVSYQVPLATRLVVNNARRRGEGELTGHNLAAVAERFLGNRMEVAGVLPHDQSVVEAVRLQSPLIQSYPRSPMALAIDKLGEYLWTGQPAAMPTQAGVGHFFRQLLSPTVMAA
jgi:flagellar biosynthesis protein FlhG